MSKIPRASGDPESEQLGRRDLAHAARTNPGKHVNFEVRITPLGRLRAQLGFNRRLGMLTGEKFPENPALVPNSGFPWTLWEAILVEPVGIEPTTSSMPWMRSPS
jgi:hypothetical protein